MHLDRYEDWDVGETEAEIAPSVDRCRRSPDIAAERSDRPARRTTAPECAAQRARGGDAGRGHGLQRHDGRSAEPHRRLDTDLRGRAGQPDRMPDRRSGRRDPDPDPATDAHAATDGSAADPQARPDGQAEGSQAGPEARPDGPRRVERGERGQGRLDRLRLYALRHVPGGPLDRRRRPLATGPARLARRGRPRSDQDLGRRPPCARRQEGLVSRLLHRPDPLGSQGPQQLSDEVDRHEGGGQAGADAGQPRPRADDGRRPCRPPLGRLDGGRVPLVQGRPVARTEPVVRPVDGWQPARRDP